MKELLARRMARWPELGAAAAPLPFLRPESTIELLPDPGRVGVGGVLVQRRRNADRSRAHPA